MYGAVKSQNHETRSTMDVPLIIQYIASSLTAAQHVFVARVVLNADQMLAIQRDDIKKCMYLHISV